MPTKKFVLTVSWSVDGFHVVEFLPTGIKFDRAHFADNIIPSLATALQMGAPKSRGLLDRLYCDNAGPHNSSRSGASTDNYGFYRISHPPDGPDLTPSDFYLFGTLKRQLKKKEFVAVEGLPRAIGQILERIPREE